MNYSMTRLYRPILVAVGLGYIIAREAPRIFAPAEAAGLPANLVHNIQTRTPWLRNWLRVSEDGRIWL
jgi:hypothetical protein